MSPKLTSPADLPPLVKQFETFEDFVAGTLTWDDGKAQVKANPTKYKYAYGLRKLNPATGEFESRCMLREHTVRETMDRIKDERAAKPAKVEAVTSNGVKMPNPTSIGGRIWAICNSLIEAHDVPFNKDELHRACKAGLGDKYNANNVMTECSLWRKFHGLTWKP